MVIELRNPCSWQAWPGLIVMHFSSDPYFVVLSSVLVISARWPMDGVKSMVVVPANITLFFNCVLLRDGCLLLIFNHTTRF